MQPAEQDWKKMLQMVSFQSNIHEIIIYDGKLTIQLVLQWPPRFSQLRAIDLLSREHSIKHQAEQVVTHHPATDLPASKAPYAIIRPGNLIFELRQRERLRLKERGGRTAGDVVAGKVKEIQQNWEAKD